MHNRFRFQSAIVRDADAGGSGGTPAATTQAPAAQTTQQSTSVQAEVFSKEYVRELREENKGWRLKASEMERAATEARATAAQAAGEVKSAAEKYAADLKAALDAAKTDAETRIGEARTSAQARIISAELKAHAVRAGMVDLDGLKLLDTAAVAIDDKGDVVIPADFFETAKTAKPWLFAAAQQATGAAHGRTSAAAHAPKPSLAGKSAREMTEAEAEAELALLIAPKRR